MKIYLCLLILTFCLIISSSIIRGSDDGEEFDYYGLAFVSETSQLANVSCDVEGRLPSWLSGILVSRILTISGMFEGDYSKRP